MASQDELRRAERRALTAYNNAYRDNEYARRHGTHADQTEAAFRLASAERAASAAEQAARVPVPIPAPGANQPAGGGGISLLLAVLFYVVLPGAVLCALLTLL